MADQLEWFSEIASQNPAMMAELEKEGRLAHGLITARVTAGFKMRMTHWSERKKNRTKIFFDFEIFF